MGPGKAVSVSGQGGPKLIYKGTTDYWPTFGNGDSDRYYCRAAKFYDQQRVQYTRKSWTTVTNRLRAKNASVMPADVAICNRSNRSWRVRDRPNAETLALQSIQTDQVDRFSKTSM